MNIIETLDNYFLDQTKKLAKYIYHLCGISHMAIAKNLLGLSYGMLVGCLLLYGSSSLLNSISALLAIFVTTLFMVIVCKLMIKNFVTLTKHTQNKSRLDFRGPRFFSLIFGLTIFIPNLIDCFYMSHWAVIVMSLIFSAGVHFLLFSIGLYFGSIEPEPPEESKLKKLLKKLARYLQSEPIAQPA